MSHTIIACPVCDLVHHVDALPSGSTAECSRCGSAMIKERGDTLTRTAALSLAALVLYVPANIYPIMRMEFHGVYTESTVWDGCVRLFQDGQWPIAIIVFLASLLIPLLKLMGLFFLVVTTKRSSQRFKTLRVSVHKAIKAMGNWAMLDVFLLAVLVSLVKLGRIATVTAGPGALAFASVVVLTIFASASFEPREIWRKETQTT